MKETAKEAQEILKDEKELKKPRAGPQTRGKKRAREVIEQLDDTKKIKDEAVAPSAEALAKERAELQMVFRLFDRDRNGHLTAEELAEVFRSLGKRPLRRKIDKIFEGVEKGRSSKEKPTILMDEFVDYMLKKRHSKLRAPAAAPAAAAAAAAAPAAAAPAASAPAPSPAPLPSRGRSITEFYTPHAGLHDELVDTAPLDPHSNPAGREYDLGREGAFSEFKILIFNGIAKDSLEQYIANPVNALRGKGFQVNITRSEEEFAAQLPSHDEAWIISGGSIRPQVISTFVNAVTAFHNAGKGLAIWADNEPLFAHANVVLEPLLGLSLQGNDAALKDLQLGDPTKPGHFGRHLLTSGIVKLFEGDSICRPTNTNNVKVLATSSHNAPCMMYADPPGKGRVVIDCGFTKFYDPKWTSTAGTERYVRNAAVWLLNLEARVPNMNAERLDTSHRQLRRGESITLEGDLGRIMIGMGWASSFDLDVSCIVYSRNFDHLDTIWFRNLRSAKYPIKHSGDILSGGRPGDLEQITVDLHRMPDEAAILMFVVNVFSFDKTFAEVQNAYVRLVDVARSLEKCRFELGKESMGKTRAMVMCKVFHSSDGKWKMMTIGEPVEGRERTVEEMIEAGILNKYIYEDYVPAGAVIQQLT